MVFFANLIGTGIVSFTEHQFKQKQIRLPCHENENCTRV